MKTIKLAVIFLSFLGLNSCNSDDNSDELNSQLEVKKIENLYAPGDIRDYQTGEIVQLGIRKYFSFSLGTTVDETAAWDIAFKGTEIITNSGVHGNTQAAAVLVNGMFSEITQAPDDSDFNVDTDILNAIASGSDNGWYHYNPTNHLITPIAGRIIIIRTNDGHYAKVEMLSYYKDQTTSPTQEDGAYLTFNYVYQDDGTKEF